MKKLILILAVSFSTAAFAQLTDAEKKLRSANSDTTNGWKKGGTFGLNATQVSFNNWAAGGENSVNINSLMNLYANFKKDKSSWDNLLNLNYGLSKQGDGEFIKADDRIEFNSKYGRKATADWYYAALFNFKSQFAPGYIDAEEQTGLTSDFMAPGYFLGAIGMDYKPNPNFTVFISPVSAKLTVVSVQSLANQGAFGVEGATYAGGNPDSTLLTEGETTRLEVGGYLRMMYKRELMKNVSFQTNFDVFSSYTDDPTHLDVNWNNLLSMKVNQYINASVSTALIYDHDITISETKEVNGVEETTILGPRTQFKYVIAVGFQYKFGE